ncbi:hypothetical protein SAMN05216373_1410 [Streptococcus equinus]|nr:hypothetical protein SAMN05216373_1410 [Streptococcus equinus]
MTNWRTVLKNILFLALGVKAVLSMDGLLVKGILVFFTMFILYDINKVN